MQKQEFGAQTSVYLMLVPSATCGSDAAWLDEAGQSREKLDSEDDKIAHPVIIWMPNRGSAVGDVPLDLPHAFPKTRDHAFRA